MRIHAHSSTHTCVLVYVCVFVCVCGTCHMFINMYVYVCIHVCICVCTCCSMLQISSLCVAVPYMRCSICMYIVCLFVYRRGVSVGLCGTCHVFIGVGLDVGSVYMYTSVNICIRV